MNKSMLPLLVFSFIAVLTLELLLKVVEHALWVAWSWGVDELFHWVGQHVVLHSGTRKSPTSHPYREGRKEGRKKKKPRKKEVSPCSSSKTSRYINFSRAQTFRQGEDFGVHLSAELLVVHQVFVIVGAQQCVVSHHFIMERCESTFVAICIFLWTGHPQCVCVLLITHCGDILPNFTQGTCAVLYS